jgi:hypothetical protein
MKNGSTIYFSYAWKDGNEGSENREQIVDDLYHSLLQEGYDVIRDKVSLGYKGQISEFMKILGRGACVVVVISDKYLKSPFCMYELLEVYRKSSSEMSELKEKIFPIVLTDARIHDPVDRLDYVIYWRKKKSELDQKIIEVGLENAGGVLDEYRIYQEITSNFSELTKLLQDMNTLSPQVLSNENFATIKKAIAASVTKPPQSPAQQVVNTQTYNIGKIRKFLENAMNDTELNTLCMDHFEDVYNRFTDGQNKPQKINLLLDYCKRNLKFNRLLEEMQEINNEQFERYKPYV